MIVNTFKYILSQILKYFKIHIILTTCTFPVSSTEVLNYKLIT